MRALLLAAGFGTRLRPLTDNVPKCLVPIKGRPLLGIWLERLSQAGFGPFLINTHYRSEQVDSFIASSAYRDRVKLAFETQLRGTAGSLIANLGFFGGQDGLLIHADNYCLADFSRFWQAHLDRPRQCLISIMTFRTDRPSTCGIVETDAHGVVTGFHEKVAEPPGNLANGAVYILSSEALAILGRDLSDATDFSTEVLPRFLGRIYSHETAATFLDIGTIENYERANSLN